MQSLFTDKLQVPELQALQNGLGDTYPLWQELEAYTHSVYPAATNAWKHSGDKYGWGYRISDKKRVLIYLLPRDGFFRAAFVFGQKATDAVLASSVSAAIKEELLAAKVFAEGRGIRIEVRNGFQLADLKQLIAIKINS